MQDPPNDPDATASDDSDLRAGLAGLARLASAEMTLPTMLTHVAEFAVRAIPGADGAGLTLLHDGAADTIVATTGFVEEVDAAQYAIGEGPCITAAAESRTVCSGSLAEDRAWAGFGMRAGELGVQSALSLPLLGHHGALGVMNVYAHAPNAFDDRAARLGELYAVPAAISVRNAQVLAQALLLASQLETALASRAVIDHALGILMSRSGSTAAEAFATLVRMSQHSNVKLGVVAQTLLDEAVRRARGRHGAATAPPTTPPLPATPLR